MEFKLIENKEPFCGICFLNAGNKKTVCLNENHFNQNKLFFIFTLILFYENNWFHEICRWIWNINKRKKYFFNSICTPFGLFDYPQSLYSWAFPQFFKLLKLANKILSLYFLVLVLWFYLVLYVFNCPKSIGCTEQCYQIVITSLLSIKDSRNILISVNYTINLYIFITNLVDNYIIFPYRIFIICPKADPFG